jgi:prepilin-type processing-associated H-X9-DG protein
MDTKTKLTKVDCLVSILGVILFLFAAGTVGKRGQELNKRMICSSNIKQLVAGMTNYTYTHNGVYPETGGYWPWDVPKSTGISILHYMGKDLSGPAYPPQDVFYCPSNYVQQVNRSMYWNFGGYFESSYSFLWYAPWNGNGKNPVLGTGNKQWVRSTYIENADKQELVLDAILSQKKNYDPAMFPNGNFGQIKVGGMANDNSNHLKTMKEPYGGNVGFVDGHVQWRPFSEMQIRWKYGNADPYWWW